MFGFLKKMFAFEDNLVLKKDIEEVVKCLFISHTLSYCYSIADATPGVLALTVLILSFFLFFYFNQVSFLFYFCSITLKCMLI